MGLQRVLLRPIALFLYAAIRGLFVLVTKPDDAPRSYAPGPDPDRILIFGNLAAVGWGVNSHQLALPGQLAIALSALTGRGVETEAIADSTMTIATAIRWLEDTKLWWFDGVLITIGMSDALCLLPPSRWRADLSGLLDHIIENTPPGTPIVLGGIFSVRRIPVFRGPLGAFGDRHARALNTITEKLCAERPDVIYTLADPIDTSAGDRSGLAERYRGEAVRAALDFLPRLAAVNNGSGTSDDDHHSREDPGFPIAKSEK